MVERHLNSLKTFVRQGEHTEGSMVEGYMVYQSLVYISHYIPKLTIGMKVPHILDVNSINRFEGEVLIGKGRIRKVKGNCMVAKIYNNFHYYFLPIL
jgi:hypothetical protein